MAIVVDVIVGFGVIVGVVDRIIVLVGVNSTLLLQEETSIRKNMRKGTMKSFVILIRKFHPCSALLTA